MGRILFLVDAFPPDLGGLATSAGRMARTFAQLGHTVDVLVWSRALSPGHLAGPDEPELGLHVYRLGRHRQWDMTMPFTLTLLEGLHHTHPYAGVWGHYLFPAGFLAVWFGERYGVPSVVSARGNDIDREAFPPGDFGRLRWTLERATRITAVTCDLAAKIRVLTRRTDVSVLGNAVDAELFSPEGPVAARAELGIAPDELVLGFSGELREKKGQNYLLAALTRVRQVRPACLLIVGEVRQAAEATLPLYAERFPQDAERIVVTGHMADPAAVARHLRAADLFVLPSLWEGLPNALLEAMACGLCCLTSDAGGIPEVIDHGKNGFLVPRLQLVNLAEAILELDQLGGAERQRIGQAGRERVLAAFSPPVERERLQNLLTGWMPSAV